MLVGSARHRTLRSADARRESVRPESPVSAPAAWPCLCIRTCTFPIGFRVVPNDSERGVTANDVLAADAWGLLSARPWTRWDSPAVVRHPRAASRRLV